MPLLPEYRKSTPKANSYTFTVLYRVSCDSCGKKASSGAVDPGEASETARKEGYITHRGINHIVGDPLEWACPKCSESFG